MLALNHLDLPKKSQGRAWFSAGNLPRGQLTFHFAAKDAEAREAGENPRPHNNSASVGPSHYPCSEVPAARRKGVPQF